MIGSPAPSFVPIKTDNTNEMDCLNTRLHFKRGLAAMWGISVVIGL